MCVCISNTKLLTWRTDVGFSHLIAFRINVSTPGALPLLQIAGWIGERTWLGPPPSIHISLPNKYIIMCCLIAKENKYTNQDMLLSLDTYLLTSCWLCVRVFLCMTFCLTNVECHPWGTVVIRQFRCLRTEWRTTSCCRKHASVCLW